MISARAQIMFRRTVVCMGFLLVALVAAAITMRLAIHGAEVQVPDLRGKTAADALRMAADAGLSATIADRFYSAAVPMGSVVAQFPDPGATVRRDWIVRLVQSLGPQTISVPNVTGLAQRDATLAIRKAHLDLGNIVVLPDAAVAAGTVMAQDPPAAAHGIDRPRVALLVASGGAAMAAQAQASAIRLHTVPNVVGMPFQQAAQSLLAAGLKLAPLGQNSATQSTGKPGIVIAESPRSGTTVRPGAPVELTLGQ